MMITLTLFEYRLFKVVKPHGVRIELRFKTETVALVDGFSAFAERRGRIKEVARVELNSGKVGIYRHRSARLRGDKSCHMAETAAVGAEVVVISACKYYLLML